MLHGALTAGSRERDSRSMRFIFLIAAGLSLSTAVIAHTGCNRQVVLKTSEALHPVTDEFQEKVKGVAHHEQLAYYAEEVHLSSHRLADAVAAKATCDQLVQEFRSMATDFNLLQLGHDRAQQKAANAQVAEVFGRLSGSYTTLSGAFKY